MPQISANSALPVGASSTRVGGADPFSASSLLSGARTSRADRAGGFNQALSAARTRTPASTSETRRTEEAAPRARTRTERTRRNESTRESSRAERSREDHRTEESDATDEAAEPTNETAHPEDATPVKSKQAGDDASQSVDDEQPVDEADGEVAEAGSSSEPTATSPLAVDADDAGAASDTLEEDADADSEPSDDSDQQAAAPQFDPAWMASLQAAPDPATVAASTATGEVAGTGKGTGSAAATHAVQGLGSGRPGVTFGAPVARPEDGEAATRAASQQDAANGAAGAVEILDSLTPETDPTATAELPPISAHHALSQGALSVLEGLGQQPPATIGQAQATGSAAAPESLAPEARFAEDNHPPIIAGVKGQLLPSGGTMQIRLDPPELGPLSVTINIRDGVMEASFETSNDQAAKLLSHSLSTLKTSLESQGVSVERLNVQQAPKSEQSGNNGNDPQQQDQPRDLQQEHAARQDQQRREVLRRMWQKLSGVEDPLDLVA